MTPPIRLESSEPEPVQGPSPQKGPELGPLLEGLEQLRTLFGQANQQIAGYLASRPAPEPAGLDLDAVLDRLDRIDRRNEATSAAIRQLQGQIEQGWADLREMLLPTLPQGGLPPGNGPCPREAKTGPAQVEVAADWEQSILGAELAAEPWLGNERRRLLQGVVTGEPAACGFAGQLLIFRGAPAERLPQLLKDVGEAYYRWQPKRSAEDSPFETALAGCLQRACEAAGINNAIELVRLGERFDSTRHATTGRGVEIVEVLGWIVLRDNGRVYTKASVGVR